MPMPDETLRISIKTLQRLFPPSMPTATTCSMLMPDQPLRNSFQNFNVYFLDQRRLPPFDIYNFPFLPIGPPIRLTHSSSTTTSALRPLRPLAFRHSASSSLHLPISRPTHSAATSALSSAASIGIRCPTPSSITSFTLPSFTPPLPPTPTPVFRSLSSRNSGSDMLLVSPKIYSTDGRTKGSLWNVAMASGR